MKNENENSEKDSIKEDEEADDFTKVKPSRKNTSKTYFLVRSTLKLRNGNSF